MTEIPLKPLDSGETMSLAEHIMGHQPDPATIAILYQETEGNPLFLVEMVRAGTLQQREQERLMGGPTFLPPKIPVKDLSRQSWVISSPLSTVSKQ